MPLEKIYPKSPDPYIKELGSNKSQAALARMAHLNPIIDYINYLETLINSSTTGITAYAGGGQTNATQLTATFNEITICATDGDSVKLLEAVESLTQIVINDGVANLEVFPFLGDKINDGTVNASVVLAPGTTVIFKAIDDTNWETSNQKYEATNSGSAALPSFTFSKSTNMGLYRISGTQLGVSVAGVLQAVIDSTAGGMLINVINERVAAAGVTIETVLLKDGNVQLGAANCGIADVAGTKVATFIPINAQQDLSGAGAINITSYYTAWTTTAANAGTLAAGVVVGQLKNIKMVVDGGDGTLTPISMAGGTTITFNDVNDEVVLAWNGTQWVVIKNIGCTIA